MTAQADPKATSKYPGCDSDRRQRITFVRHTRREKPRATRALAAIMPVIATLVVGTPALAEPGSARNPSVKARANVIMTMTYSQFDRYSGVKEPPFNWTNDGCSHTPRGWANLFRKACNMHDFGYRNYGASGRLRLGPDEDTRKWIDGRLLEEMKRLCDDYYSAWSRAVNKFTCVREANSIYGTVRAWGRFFY